MIDNPRVFLIFICYFYLFIYELINFMKKQNLETRCALVGENGVMCEPRLVQVM